MCIKTGMRRTPKNRRSKNTVPVSISSAYGIDTVQRATTSYERWMSSCTTVLPTDLRLKHQQMKADPFLFLRGTFYRWAQMWSQAGGDLCNAPKFWRWEIYMSIVLAPGGIWKVECAGVSMISTKPIR